MLVGEVRCAIAGPGSSWKLSGGSQWSASPTKVSKNAQVLRAILRRNRACASVRWAARRCRGRLSHQAIPGDANQSASTGRAAARALGPTTATPANAATDDAGATHIERTLAPSAPDAACSTYGLHSSRPRRARSMRHTVRSTAPRLTTASCGRQAMRMTDCARPRPIARATAAMWRPRASSRGLRNNATTPFRRVGNGDQAKKRESPAPRAWREMPAHQRQHHERRRHQAASQVVEDLPA